ncbi:MAG: hypothetical protein LUH02_01485 [Erysipelotrichaceae bacterium]|nr:hypothetical protein [Erysipelotrichaceae bacterium]
MVLGKKTAPKLINIGINTIGDLAKYENYEKIRPIFGRNAMIYYQRANGKDYSKLHIDKDNPKSIGHSITFENDSHDETYIHSVFYQLSQKVSMRAKEKHLVSRSSSISITLKYDLNHNKSKQMIIDDYTNDSNTIYATAISLFESIYHGEDLRLIGVCLNDVVDAHHLRIQMSINDQSLFYQDPTDKLINELNHEGIYVMRASELLKK